MRRLLLRYWLWFPTQVKPFLYWWVLDVTGFHNCKPTCFSEYLSLQNPKDKQWWGTYSGGVLTIFIIYADICTDICRREWGQHWTFIHWKLLSSFNQKIRVLLVPEIKTKEIQGIVRDGGSLGAKFFILQMGKPRPWDEGLPQGHVCRNWKNWGYLADVRTFSPNSLH